MIGPRVALATTTAPAKPRVYSGFLSIWRMVTSPGPAASALALPLMPEKIPRTQISPDGAGKHDVSGKDKKRNRQQEVYVVQAIADLFCHETHILAFDQQIADARSQHGKANGHTQHHAGNEHTYEDRDTGIHDKCNSVSNPTPRSAFLMAQAQRMTRPISNNTKGR